MALKSTTWGGTPNAAYTKPLKQTKTKATIKTK